MYTYIFKILLDRDTIKKDIVKIYEDLLKDTEHEVRSVIILHLPEICK